jgi:hypothetical protein
VVRHFVEVLDGVWHYLGNDDVQVLAASRVPATTARIGFRSTYTPHANTAASFSND